MFSLLKNVIFSYVAIWICRLLGAISNQWDWSLFFLAVAGSSRALLLCQRGYCRDRMKTYLDYLEKTGDKIVFDEDQKTLLISASGIILLPKMLFFEFFRRDSAALCGLCEIINISLFAYSLFHKEYHISIVAFIIFLLGYGFWLWQPNFFYSGNRRMDSRSILLLYLKAKGENIKTMDESKLEGISTFIYITLILFDGQYKKDHNQ